MTYPSSDVNTTNADATTDSPSLFRVDVLDLITKFNLLRNHISTFVQGLLSSANAAAARITLAAAESGTNTDITSLASPAIAAATATTQAAADNTTKVATTAHTKAAISAALAANVAAIANGGTGQTTAAAAANALGVLGTGASLSNLARSLNTNYTNGTGRTMVVMGYVVNAGSAQIQILLNGNQMGYVTAASGSPQMTFWLMVPHGWYYNINVTAGSTSGFMLWEQY